MSARQLIETALQPELPLTGETLVSAAIRFADGFIARGRSHPLIFQAMDKDGKLTKYENTPFEDGFMTSLGRFVDREEGMEIARDQNQNCGSPETGLLHSEITNFR